jgi:uncharacterized protein
VKVVVAGGSGLIGRALCSALGELGHQPVVLSRDPQRARLPSGARSVAWHPPTREAWVAELSGAGAVVNLAGESIGAWPWTARRKRALRESRLVATQTLVAALASVPPDERPAVLVNSSGADIYEGRDDVPATESTPPADTFLARLCVDWEAEARKAEELGVRVVLARTSVVIAPGAPSMRLLALPFRLFAGGPVGSGRQWFSWVDLDDAAALIAFSLTSEISGALNLAAPDPRQQADFARALGAALGRPSWLWTPAWAIRMVLRDQATLALGSRRVWPAKALESGFAFTYPRLEDSLGRFGS